MAISAVSSGVLAGRWETVLDALAQKINFIFLELGVGFIKDPRVEGELRVGTRTAKEIIALIHLGAVFRNYLLEKVVQVNGVNGGRRKVLPHDVYRRQTLR